MVDLLVERCAGLDVAKREVVACVRTPDPGAGGRRRQAIRTFPTFSAELEALADWLQAEGIAVGRSQVRRILLAERVRWRRTRSWATSTDPDFAPKGRRSSPATPARRRT